MKTLMISLAAAAALTAGAASAQGYNRNPNNDWMPINMRQEQLDRRIDRGIASGELTRREAVRARATFNDIARLESRYRRGGLSEWERADLDRRFDALAAQIRWDRHDGNRRYGWNQPPRPYGWNEGPRY